MSVLLLTRSSAISRRRRALACSGSPFAMTDSSWLAVVARSAGVDGFVASSVASSSYTQMLWMRVKREAAYLLG
jgi:hypothetical protein